MARFLAAVLGLAMFAVVGCHNDKHDDMHNHDAMKASADACPTCPGVQTATADGKCPVCGAKVASAKMMSVDACAHCPGVQTATADGKCPVCGASVAAMKQ